MKKRFPYECPECHCDDVDCYDYEVDTECCSFKMSCNACDTTWKEFFALRYDGYFYDKLYDKDGNLIHD